MVNPLPPSSSSATHIHTKAPKRQGLHGCWPRVSLWTHQYKRMRSVPFSFLGKVHLFLPVLWLAFQPRQAERVTVSHLNPGLNEGKRRSSTAGSGQPENSEEAPELSGQCPAESLSLLLVKQRRRREGERGGKKGDIGQRRSHPVNEIAQECSPPSWTHSSPTF